MTHEDAPDDSLDGVKVPDPYDSQVTALEYGTQCAQVEEVGAEQLRATVCSGTTVVTNEDDSMSDALLEQGIKLIRQAFAAEGKRAIDEFIANLQSTIGGTKADVI